jgi:hypothetical protein
MLTLSMSESKSLMFICPFWGQDGHVGTIRAQRHVNWLLEEGFKVTIVKAGLTDRVEEQTFGEMITIRDPFRMFDDMGINEIKKVARKPNKIRRFLGYLLLIPDPTIIWAKRVAKHTLVLNRAGHHKWFMASSPTESAFIPASELAIKYNGLFWMDLRDGWLDEPMKPLLRTSGLQRFRERLIERKMIDHATIITVTSSIWKKLLVNRYPKYESKIHVIPNTFEQNKTIKCEHRFQNESILKFIYAGRIFSSRPERSLELLLNTLSQYIELHNIKVSIEFIGTLSTEEEIELTEWSKILKNITILRSAQLKRKDLFNKMSLADGLLLISESTGSIPAKFYDYAVSGRPILAVTSKESAFDLASKEIEWVNKIYVESKQNAGDVISKFCEMTSELFNEVELPEDYTQKVVKNRLMGIL